jgi:transcriptional regulator with XRE-family HTH domain
MGELGLTQEALAVKARTDLSTVNTFLNGRTWPQVRTRARLETALDWPVGTLSRLASGAHTDGTRAAEVAALREELETIQAALRAALDRLNRLS